MSLNISDITASDRIPTSNLPDNKINLKNGEIISAVVVRKVSEGEMLISAKGRQFNVFTNLNLPEGSRQLFEVSLIGSKIELNLLQEPFNKTEQPSAIVSAVAAKETLTDILSELKTALDRPALSRLTAQEVQNLRQILPNILYGISRDHNGTWIKENILSSGLFWENKILDILSDEKNNPIKKIMKNDLKAILLLLQKRLIGENNDGTDDLILKIKQATNLIEGNQLLNLSSLEKGLGWLFSIPGSIEDGFRDGKIFVKKGDGKSGIFFSVFLEFTQLGSFEADVSMMESMISVRIIMDDKKKARMVKDDISLLEKGLKAVGMTDVIVSCDVRKENETAGSLSSEFLNRSQGVNIVI
jgi:hypothetical protein